jgi:L-threonylcarbamoyladenylate synthase
MDSKWYHVDSALQPNDLQILSKAAEFIRAGGVVAIPTETVYGLAANALDERAVARIFAVKNRPADNPLIVHVSSPSQLSAIALPLTNTEQTLIKAFWPGPFTLILKAKTDILPHNVTVGLSTVAVRQPNHPIALAFIEACGVPLAAPSANLSGKPSPTSASHVAQDIFDHVDAILDGGTSKHGIESTVVQCVDQVVYVLRPGSITKEQIQGVLPDVQVRFGSAIDDVSEKTPQSPGMKYKHYAPQGELVVVQGKDEQKLQSWVATRLQQAKDEGHKTGILTFSDHANWYEADCVLTTGLSSQPEEMARDLYEHLRMFDVQQVTFMIAEACVLDGVGIAVMNRLLKAASHQLIVID